MLPRLNQVYTGALVEHFARLPIRFMNATLVEKKFETMGARVKVKGFETRRGRPVDPDSNVQIDIKRDKEGEYFEIMAKEEAKLLVMDVQKKDRHLLLMARDNEWSPLKFLCGHKADNAQGPCHS